VEVEHGAKVIDQNGELLGTVDHLMRNLWTGEVSKFMVRREAPDEDLFLSPEDVMEVTGSTVKLKFVVD
jgi:sporulation protein YlmC with PRC-barrel domain